MSTSGLLDRCKSLTEEEQKKLNAMVAEAIETSVANGKFDHKELRQKIKRIGEEQKYKENPPMSDDKK